MNCKSIIFPKVNEVVLEEHPLPELGENDVLVKMACTAISAGTERASLNGETETDALGGTVTWPRSGGYSGAGIVHRVGENVENVKVGDRVAVMASHHSSYCVLNKSFVFKIPFDDISLEEASMMYISTFSLSGVRHTRLEMGESAVVMGLGILGMFAVQYCRCAGAAPVIAVDPIEEKREDALRLGADYALNPFDADFAERVKSLTNGGVNTAIEVTGNGQALNQLLDCTARYGRISLLGCTRNSDFSVDFYRKVHYPGISLIGAHTGTRPDSESRPGYWCYKDEFNAVFNLIESKRVDYKAMINEIHSPTECAEVYERLINEKTFPCGVIFDWRKIGE